MIRTTVLVLAFAVAAAHAQPGTSTPTKAAPAAKQCDTTKVHTGPRGGKYRLSANCKKVYLRKSR